MHIERWGEVTRRPVQPPPQKVGVAVLQALILRLEGLARRRGVEASARRGREAQVQHVVVGTPGVGHPLRKGVALHEVLGPVGI